MVTRATVDELRPRFLALCEAYLENPEILTGLELDDMAVRFKQVVLDELKDERLASLLFDLRRLIPRRELDEFRRLLEKLRDGLAAHGFT